MKPSLSVIIPCYNCADTLKEAVDSCFIQGLDSFEIVMVDDGSKDSTKEVMKILKEEHPEIKIFFHEKNKGGGAARNTAIRNTSSDVIFCLDSDDILPMGTLSRMLSYLQKKNADAVGIHRSIKFKGKNIKDIEVVHEFGYVDKRIPIEALIEKKGGEMNPLYSTFMHTRRVFDITGGYPEDHGFDTQAFAWRFLANGLVAYTCPNAEYLHRINFHKSYYIREAEGGRINLNWFKIFEEFLFLFNDEAKKKILSFSFDDYTKNIYDSLKKLDNLFIKDVEEYTKPYCKENKINEITIKTEEERTGFDMYWLGSEYIRRKNFLEAKQSFVSAKKKRYYYVIVDEKIFLCEQILAGGNVEEEIRKIEINKQNKLPIWKQFMKFLKQRIKKVIGFIQAVRSHIHARKENKRFISLCFHLFLSRIMKLCKVYFEVTRYDDVPLDILIVTTSKDFVLLEEYLQGLRSNLCQRINTIYLVSFPKQEIVDFCKKQNIVFVDERDVLGYGKDAINYKVNGLDRSGWMLQQLLKLYGDTVVKTENFLSVCSDTILVNKNSFMRDGKFIFFENEEWYEPYFKGFKKLFGYDTKNTMSFTSHMMIFNAKKLKLLRKELEEKHSMSWDKAYMSTISETEMSCISDYDTYANWVLYNFPEEVITEPLYNTSLTRTQLPALAEMMPSLKKKYKTISFHAYNKD